MAIVQFIVYVDQEEWVGLRDKSRDQKITMSELGRRALSQCHPDLDIATDRLQGRPNKTT